jgi:hypothetical protein
MTAGGVTAESAGVEYLNLAFSYLDTREVAGFTYGVLCHGSQANGGFGYNESHIGYVHDNKVNLRLKVSGTGFCNENIFFGGGFSYSSTYPNYAGTINILIDHFAATALNNNRFYSPSLECADNTTVIAEVNGLNNVFLYPRFEGPSGGGTFTFKFTANAVRCSLIGQFNNAYDAQISDLGQGSVYETQQGYHYTAQSLLADDKAVLNLRAYADSQAELIRGTDAAGSAKSFAFNGDGVGWLARRLYCADGIRWSTSSGTFTDRGLFVSTGDPNTQIAANPGSLCMNLSGGAGATLWVKESGGGNTGWVAK